MTVDDIRSLRREVAAACRVLATEGYSDLTLGSERARMPGQDAVLIQGRGPGGGDGG
ncbi:MAG: hypothetical protein R2878_06625 [Thermoleophilia bacterium]